MSTIRLDGLLALPYVKAGGHPVTTIGATILRGEHFDVTPFEAEQIALRVDEHLGELVEGLEGPVIAPRVLPASAYDAVSRTDFRLWCHARGIYGIPTEEAITWLVRFFRRRTAIEIGGAHGVFGHALSIPSTDSFVQREPEVVAYHALTRQPTVQYAKRVEKLDAVTAVKQYRPSVVFGSWVTQFGMEGAASMFGVREDQILSRKHVEAYVVFGARSTHSGKAIRGGTPKGWRMREETHPGFRSRSLAPATMFIWERV